MCVLYCVALCLTSWGGTKLWLVPLESVWENRLEGPDPIFLVELCSEQVWLGVRVTQAMLTCTGEMGSAMLPCPMQTLEFCGTLVCSGRLVLHLHSKFTKSKKIQNLIISCDFFFFFTFANFSHCVGTRKSNDFILLFFCLRFFANCFFGCASFSTQ